MRETWTDTRQGARLPHVVIIGAGFAGLRAARTLGDRPVHVTILDRENHHVFQPLLYEVATAALNPAEVATPIRSVLRSYDNVDVRMAEVQKIDRDAKCVYTAAGTVLYDYLVVAAGAEPNYFGHDEWAERAPSLKSVAHALDVRRRILSAFEAAESEPDPQRRRTLLTFVVIGGGPTGVELAGTLADVAQTSFRGDYRHFDPRSTRIVLVEGQDRLLGGMDGGLAQYALETLRDRGVEVLLGDLTDTIDETGIEVGGERIEANTIIWAAGVKPSPLAQDLGPTTTRGQVAVDRDLSVPSHPEIFVVGDMMAYEQDGDPVPGLAQAALQSGDHAARCILADRDDEPRPSFRYRHRGAMAVVARGKAVAELPRFSLRGFPAWFLAWVIHIFWLILRRDRVAVFLGWAYAYLTARRPVRIIVSKKEKALPEGRV